MTKARILADYVAGGTTAAEFDYMDGVTSNVQTQLDAKAPLASPTFTGNFTSVGIDDNADATAITIDSSERVGINTASGSATSLLTISQNADTSAIDIYGYDDMSSKKGSLSVNDVGYTQLRSHSDRGMDFKSGETSGSQFRWFSDESQKMTLDASGRVGIGETAPVAKLHVQDTYSGGGDGMVHFQSDGSEAGVTWETTANTARKIKWGLASNGKFNVYDETNSILCFYIATNGVVHGDFNDTSDESLKKNIQSLDSGALSKINSLRPVSFDWKEKGKGSSVGFIAQEVEKIFPSEVIGEEYVEDQVTEATYYTNSDVLPEGKKVGDIKTEAFTTAGNLGKAINTSGIVAHLTKAVQELSAKVTALENA